MSPGGREDSFERVREGQRIRTGLLLHAEDDGGLVLTGPRPVWGASTPTRPRSATRMGTPSSAATTAAPISSGAHAAPAGDQVFRAADDEKARRDIFV